MKNDNDIAARMQRLFDLWGKFDRVYFKILHRWNLSYNSYLLLEELYHHPEGLEPAATADRLSIPRQTMTFVLDSLERDGHLERLPHPAARKSSTRSLKRNERPWTRFPLRNKSSSWRCMNVSSADSSVPFSAKRNTHEKRGRHTFFRYAAPSFFSVTAQVNRGRRRSRPCRP